MSWSNGSITDVPERFKVDIILGHQKVTFTISEKQEDGTYNYQSYALPVGAWGYSVIVNAIVSAEYPNDRMQAIINNYLLDPSNEATTEEFNIMQDYRKKAKAWATDLLAYVTENNLW